MYVSKQLTLHHRLQDRVTQTKDALINAEKEAFMLRTQMQEALNSRNETSLE